MKEIEVGEGAVEAPPLADVPVGREAREVRLLAKLLDGFANPVRLSVLLLLAREGEASVGELVEAIGGPAAPRLGPPALLGVVRIRQGAARRPKRLLLHSGRAGTRGPEARRGNLGGQPGARRGLRRDEGLLR